MISKIKDLFDMNETVYFFDVDGVLAVLEFGIYNHFDLDDDSWILKTKEEDLYQNVRVNKTIQRFLNDKDKSRVYVITRSATVEEFECKKKFANINFGILYDHIYMVDDFDEKLNVMNEIKNLYPTIEDKFFVMIDDSVGVLNNIKEHSNYSTVHVSSFFE